MPLVPFAALLLAPVTHPERPLRVVRTLLAAIGAVAAFVLYVELRKKFFPAPIDTSLVTELAPDAPWYSKAHHAFMEWFHQPVLPKDPLNNPLAKADTPHRIGGALRVYWRGLTQIVVPKTLSGDYSFPQEPIPETVWFPESILGAAMMVLPPLASLAIWVRSLFVEDRERSVAQRRGDVFELSPAEVCWLLVGVGLTWIVVSYFPHSNIPAVLPTVRAERFWYFPAIGSSLVLAIAFVGLFHSTRHIQDGSIAVGLFTLFFTFQCGKAYQHSTHYRDDLTFWSATRDAVPNSAKAHLNYSVMWGARGRLDIRRDANGRALELAPTWPMAHVYMGDTICRMHKPEEAWPYYESGFKLADNDPNLLSLGLQCMWDEQVIDEEGETVRSFKIHEAELTKMCDERPGTWLNYLVRDMSINGETNNGVDPKYRPRGYNEGPKELEPRTV
ncbi:MAG: tetratricopeptide repeat protein [Polyangiaceae bacterium]